MKKLIAYTDGGARGTPGPAGIGVTFQDHRGLVAEIYRFIGTATNNVAEYSALIAALEYAKAENTESLTVYSDSELMVKQVLGLYQVRDHKLKPLHARVRELITSLTEFHIHQVPREQNTEADALANEAMDVEADGIRNFYG